MERLYSITGTFSIIVLVLLIGYSTSDTTTMDPIEAVYEKYENNECFHIYNVSIDMRYDARHGIFPAIETDFKCFEKCLFKVYDLIDDSGAIKTNSLEGFIPNRDMHYFDTILENCLPQSNKLEHKLGTCESIYEFILCCHKIAPILVDYLPI